MPFRDLEEVYIASEIIEASVVMGILEDADMEPRLRDMTVTPYPVSVGPMGEKRIAVPRENAARARRLLCRAVEDGVLSGRGRIT